jgi:flagellin
VRINQNISAMAALRNLSTNNDKMTKSLDKLSSGFRINRAADDAAGLVISEGLRSQVGGLKVAMRNAQDGISVVQTAEGALTEVHSILQRMRDLTVQASNTGTNGDDALDAMQAEVTQLKDELDRIVGGTKFNGVSLLDGTFGVKPAEATGFVSSSSITFAADDTLSINVDGTGAEDITITAGTYTGAQLAAHIESGIKTALSGGSTAQKALADKISVTAESVGSGFALSIKAELANGDTFTVADGAGTAATAVGLQGATVTGASGTTGGSFQVGAEAGQTIDIVINDLDTTALGVNGVDLTDTASHATSLGDIDDAILAVSTERGKLGALQNRFEHTIANIGVAMENISASESRIRDTDMASEMAAFTRNQIMTQAGTAMLAQANATSQNVLSLLR